MKIIELILFEVWVIKQFFSKYSEGLFIKTPSLEGVIQLNKVNSINSFEERVFYTNLLFSKAFSRNDLVLNDKKGKLKINFLTFNIECVFEEDFNELNYNNICIEF